jgi:signal peptidase I
VVAACASFGLLRLVCCEGLLRPVRIAGASMAQTLAGDHYQRPCQDCGYLIRFDAEDPLRGNRLVCPNCGFVHHGVGAGECCRGDRVLIDRLSVGPWSPRRWDVVAFRTPGEETTLGVKRLVGLPGERLELRGGDVYVDGRIVRKSLAQLRSFAIPVHDSAYGPSSSAAWPPRWAPESDASDWKPTGKGFSFAGSHRDPVGRHTPGPLHDPTHPARVGGSSIGPADSSGNLDWLTYRHWRCFTSAFPRSEESAILDHYGYAPSESRQLHPVTDLLLVCWLRWESEDGLLAFRADNGRARFVAGLRLSDLTAALTWNDRTVLRTTLPAAAYARGVRVEFATCDQRVALAVDGQTVFEYDYVPSPDAVRPPSRPLALGAAGALLTIERLQVFRDLYYLEPAGLGRDWAAPRALMADEYFVLGDNVPASQDSRHWPTVSLPRRLLLGRVIRLR